MFSHCMWTQGQQHHWLSRVCHVTRVTWLRQAWLVSLAADGHLNPDLPTRVWATDLRRRGGGSHRPFKHLGPPMLRGCSVYWASDDVMVTVGHTCPRADCTEWSVTFYSLWYLFRSQQDIDIKHFKWEKTRHVKQVENSISISWTQT